MNEAVCTAYAKINLSLDVVSKMENGYHALRMIMEQVTLCDDIRLRPASGTGVRLETNLSYLPRDGRNIAVKAARIFFQETGIRNAALCIKIRKRIPVCAGLGGGSADAAAVLRALNRLYGTGLPAASLRELGERLGSDVPYCVSGGTALAEGRGERLTPLPALPPCHILLCKPGFSISTATLFRRIRLDRIRHRPDTAGLLQALEGGDLAAVARRMYNVFEEVLGGERGEVEALKSALLDHGALGASMSGTGPTVFGIFDDREKAAAAFEALRAVYRECFLTENVPAVQA